MRNSQRAIAVLLGVIVVVLVAVAIWVRVAAPKPRELSGETTTKTYDLSDFDGVDVTGPWQVTIARGDAWQVSVVMPAEVVDEVRVDRDGGELDLQGPWWLGDLAGREGPVLQATITMPALESVHISGISRLSFSGFTGRALSLDLSGAGQLNGTASRFDRLDLDMSGAAAIDLSDVAVTDADVDVSGAGSVKLQMAGGRLTGDLSGAASLEYSGTVSEETVDKSGFVNVRRRN
jgi:Putative auto-transporter adhesin, head GIN domain